MTQEVYFLSISFLCLANFCLPTSRWWPQKFKSWASFLQHTVHLRLSSGMKSNTQTRNTSLQKKPILVTFLSLYFFPFFPSDSKEKNIRYVKNIFSVFEGSIPGLLKFVCLFFNLVVLRTEPTGQATFSHCYLSSPEAVFLMRLLLCSYSEVIKRCRKGTDSCRLLERAGAGVGTLPTRVQNHRLVMFGI